MSIFEYDQELHEKTLYEEGYEDGEAKGIIQLICRKLKKEKSFDQIVDEMEMPKEEVQPLYDTAMSFAPEYDEEQIYEALCKLK